MSDVPPLGVRRSSGLMTRPGALRKFLGLQAIKFDHRGELATGPIGKCVAVARARRQFRYEAVLGAFGRLYFLASKVEPSRACRVTPQRARGTVSIIMDMYLLTSFLRLSQSQSHSHHSYSWGRLRACRSLTLKPRSTNA